MSRGGIIRRLFGLVSGRSGSGVFVTGLLLVTVLVLFGSAWAKWGKTLTQGGEYQLRLDRITVTDPPEWIRVDVKSVVFRDGSLAELSMLDRKLAVKVARAFELHPWVAKVKWVRKTYPGQVEVELEYRQPVAMVEVLTDNRPGLLPVDAEGVLLQPRDFSEAMAEQFLRIATDHKHPLGVVGASWGDKRVVEAAAIASFLVAADWQAIGLYRVEVDGSTAGGRAGASDDQPHEYYITTPDKLRIYWGRAPGAERPHEPAAAVKVERLIELARAKGRLSPTNIRGAVDLRDPEGIKVIVTPGNRSTIDKASY